MRRVRYIARIRGDLLVAIPLLATAGVFVVVLGRLLIAGARPFLEAVVFPLPSLPLQAGVYVLGLALATTVVVWLGSRIPRKILVFEDHARLKYVSYRSVILRPEDIAECRRASFSDVWMSRRLWRCLALTFGIGTRGVYLRRHDGRALFFRTRRPDEVIQAVASIGATGSGHASPS